MEGSLSYLVVDNPSQLLFDNEAWINFRQILAFRDKEMSSIWPGHNWTHGADIHCTHCAVLFEDRIAGVIRFIDATRVKEYGTISPVFESLEEQPPEIAHLISENLTKQIRNTKNRLVEFGQFIMAEEFRSSRIAVKTQMRRKLNALTVRTARLLGYNGMYALSREEANTIKIFADIGTRALGEPDRLVYKNGCVSRVMFCDGFSSSFMDFVSETESELILNTRVFSRHLNRTFFQSLTPPPPMPYPEAQL